MPQESAGEIREAEPERQTEHEHAERARSLILGKQITDQ
jgi:hypothetical protein